MTRAQANSTYKVRHMKVTSAWHHITTRPSVYPRIENVYRMALILQSGPLFVKHKLQDLRVFCCQAQAAMRFLPLTWSCRQRTSSSSSCTTSDSSSASLLQRLAYTSSLPRSASTLRASGRGAASLACLADGLCFLCFFRGPKLLHCTLRCEPRPADHIP